MEIYLVDPNGAELNLTNFGASSSRFVNEYPKGAFDFAPVEHISRYTADGLPYLDTYRRRPVVIDLKLTAVGSTAVNLWSEIATILAKTWMSKTPCKLKVVENGKTVYLDVHPESSSVIPAVSSGEITLRLVSYGRWYKATENSSSLTVGASSAFNYIAIRDDNGWSQWSTGANQAVDDIVVAPDGSIYVGGNFTTIGGIAANYIAKWNGSSWSALDTGMDDRVYALAVAPDGTLYAGGAFTTAGGVTANRIAKWSGSSWSALDTGMDDGQVYALAIAPDGTLYAGGYFSTAGGVTAYNIAKWNGTTWSALGGGLTRPGYPSSCSAIAITRDGQVYAGGLFTVADDSVSVKSIARWNGSAWYDVGGGLTNPDPLAYPPKVNAIVIMPDGTLYAGGQFSQAGSSLVPVANIAVWDGVTWKTLGNDLYYTTTNGVNDLKVADNGYVYAAGLFNFAPSGIEAERLMIWNGYRWVVNDTTFKINSFIISNNKIYAGGDENTTKRYGALSVINAASEVYPVIQFTASTAADVAYIENSTTGQKVWIKYAMLPGETITLDFSKSTVTSSFAGNILYAIIPGSDMRFRLVPGDNKIIVYKRSGTVTGTIRWTDLYSTLAEALQ